MCANRRALGSMACGAHLYSICTEGMELSLVWSRANLRVKMCDSAVQARADDEHGAIGMGHAIKLQGCARELGAGAHQE